ncbi:MAG: hypothetical protein ACRC76_12420 [Proteocatella sp.]
MENFVIEPNCDFALVHIHLNNEGFAQREVVKNDTVITLYKDRFYQHCLSTGIRYAYVPTNSDLQAKDWKLLFFKDEKGVGLESIHKNHIKNILLEYQNKF